MRRSRFTYWLQSPEGKKFRNWGYGIGALLVLIGAILKLMHWHPNPWMSFILPAGFTVGAITYILDTFAKQVEDENNDDSL